MCVEMYGKNEVISQRTIIMEEASYYPACEYARVSPCPTTGGIK